MIRNYFKITYRNLVRHKSYSLINILGLAFAITCCVLILAYIGYELSFDAYHDNADNIYRIATRSKISGRTQEQAVCPTPLGPMLVKDFPEAIDVARFSPTVKRAFNYQGKKFFEEGVFYADKSIFNVFSYELLEGDPDTALEVPFTMVLTPETAQKYFGDESPVGKIIKWDNNFDYTITGVIKAPPSNSHFTFRVLASLSTYFKYDPRIQTSWRGSVRPAYLLLRENTDLELFTQKIENFNEKFLLPMAEEIGAEIEIFLQPLKSIHLHSNLPGELGINSNIKVIYTFSTIAFVLLLLACINFMNLATARSANRAKEIGLRKVLGADRKGLIFQFLIESFVFAGISLIIAIIAAKVFLPYFKTLADREISLNYLQIPQLFAGLVGIVLFTGLIAGSYPAFFLSAFKPIAALKGHIQRGIKSSRFRSVLVIFQFSISTVLIICTIIIFNQQKYMQNKDLGFNKNNLLVVALQNKEVRSILESFKTEVLNIEGVASAGATSMVPGEMYLFSSMAYPEGFTQDQGFSMDNFLVDQDYLNTLQVDIIQGRGFSQEITTDATDAIIINETAAIRLEWEDPVGKTIDISQRYSNKTDKKTVIGVFRDIHQRSLYAAVAPTFIRFVSNVGPIENRARRLCLRLGTNNLPGTLEKIQQKWQEVYPDHPYYSFFLDDFYQSRHRAEEKLGNLFRIFSIIAVIIGCIGLFGLAAFIAEKRTREIGIRKVLGSSVSSVVMLLCREFILLVVIANTVAWPIAFFAIKKWLQNFPYPVSIALPTFMISSSITLIIAFMTVGYQSLRAARANPIESLRYE